MSASIPVAFPSQYSSPLAVANYSKVASPLVLNKRKNSQTYCSKIVLTRGAVVIAGRNDTVIETNLGMIHTPKNSVVLLLATEASIGIFNLHDDHTGVVIKTNSTSLRLRPGQHALLTRQKTPNFEDLNLAQNISYKSPQLIYQNEHGGSPTAIFLTQFELSSTLATVVPLRDLLTSKHEAAKKIANSLLKTAAIISDLSANSRNYSKIPHRDKLAYQNH